MLIKSTVLNCLKTYSVYRNVIYARQSLPIVISRLFSIQNNSVDRQLTKPPNIQNVPNYFHYFSKFIADNGFPKQISPDLLFSYKRLLEELDEIYEIISNDSSNLSASNEGDNDEFFELARKEFETLSEQLQELQNRIISQSVVDDCNVDNCTLEIRAGVGGKEASLFAEELFKIYLRFISYNGWQVKDDQEEFEQVNIDDSSSLLTNTVEVVGVGSYRLLRHEAGIHRVQRVPQTEKYGRIHTSTVSISVIPIRHNLVVVKDSDLKFDVKNSSGAGGQNVNRNLTCVRCTHIPTGHVTESQETRYQYQNKVIAIRKMRALLNQLEYDKLEREARAQKQLQIGIASRSDKIRTYNFPQNRITDHRLSSISNIDDDGGGEHSTSGDDHKFSSSLHNIESYMRGEELERMRSIMERLELSRHLELTKQVRAALQQGYSSHQQQQQQSSGKHKG